MDTRYIKQYAPKAREQFREAVKEKLILLGIEESGILPVEKLGDHLRIGNSASLLPASIEHTRARLVEHCMAEGEFCPNRYEQLIEQGAYTWFNRFSAIRYMELHGYLPMPQRLLSNRESDSPYPFEVLMPEHIMEVAEALEITNLKEIQQLALDNDSETLYRRFLLAASAYLHKSMPFLFEAMGDEFLLLLPANLTSTQSLIKTLVEEIPEEDWHNVEIIGWLYQYYISEKKDEVIGKTVKSEDIPAATQLFTPNWIVQYLVQNSVGRYWLQSYPDSPLVEKMPYYIAPAEQSDEVNATLSELTPLVINPEEITVLDPACGSGHILLEAYNTLKEIYREAGYLNQEIPRLILERNLFGLDIDDRAAQLAGFALLMLAAKDDRTLLSNPVALNIHSIQESNDLSVDTLWQDLGVENHTLKTELSQLLLDFTDAKTFGSLIQIEADRLEAITELHTLLEEGAKSGDTFKERAAHTLLPLVTQARLLAQRYDAVIANPPYMGSRAMNGILKKFADKNYKEAKSDLFAMFMQLGFYLAKKQGWNAQINMHSWMFISSFEKLRDYVVNQHTLSSMLHLGARAFPQIGGEVVQTAAWVINNHKLHNYMANYIRLVDFKSSKLKESKTLEAIQNRDCEWFYESNADDFNKIPGSPIAYWLIKQYFDIFQEATLLSEIAQTRKGMVTANNKEYVRNWFEVAVEKMATELYGDRRTAQESRKKWFSYLNGGGVSKWYGNKLSVVNWENDGCLLRTVKNPKNKNKVWATNFNLDYIFKANINWGAVSSKAFTARISKGGELFDAGGSACFIRNNVEIGSMELLGFLNSKLSNFFLAVFNPTLNFQAGNISNLPILFGSSEQSKEIVSSLIDIHKKDWDAYETSWNFTVLPLLQSQEKTIAAAYNVLRREQQRMIGETQLLEEENNRHFIEAYGLTGELSPEVPLNEITLTCNPFYRYGGDLTDKEREARFQSDTIRELLSYIIGCRMGRYSLDREGLIYANAGNSGFDALVEEGAYKTFPPDKDGFIPLTSQESGWFSNCATEQVISFVRTVWGDEQLEENLTFIAESLTLHAIKPSQNEFPRQTIDRYFDMQFYKDHCQTYQKTPIYWLVSSGKKRAFECLIYLHRYNEATLSRMRMDYVVPLLGRMRTRLEHQQGALEAAESTTEKNRLKRTIKALEDQLAELSKFDEKMRNFAEKRISIDLDDGVKVNYARFKEILAKI